MAAGPSHRPLPPALASDWALFLDVDGTLLEFAPLPGAVRVEPELVDTLQRLHQRLDGALALISGRPLSELDELFSPLQLPAVGLHGLQQRDAAAEDTSRPEELDRVLRIGAAVARLHPGALAEDKGVAVALHWRGAPGAEPVLRELADAALERLSGYRLQPGNKVVELRPAGADKGEAIERLLQQPPFLARRPVFIGDDLTDESGFRAVAQRGGLAVLVGDRHPSSASFAFPNPSALRHWLRGAALLPNRKSAE